ncbi:hypothetical protein GJAV_G00270860 [Gymnothorax javanicus]|nr:hypothetical protein GJAV_G00270860 [Gymnothorax javanicus]
MRCDVDLGTSLTEGPEAALLKDNRRGAGHLLEGACMFQHVRRAVSLLVLQEWEPRPLQQCLAEHCWKGSCHILSVSARGDCADCTEGLLLRPGSARYLQAGSQETGSWERSSVWRRNVALSQQLPCWSDYADFLNDLRVNAPCVVSPSRVWTSWTMTTAQGKERKREEALTQHNTAQNEAMTSDPAATYVSQETPRAAGRQRSVGAPGSEEEGAGGSSRHRLGYGRQGRESGASAGSGLEKRVEELEKELAQERQESSRLLRAHQDKDELILKLKEEIDLLNRDLDDIEEENEQLKQENKTLLKVVGQLTR